MLPSDGRHSCLCRSMWSGGRRKQPGRWAVFLHCVVYRARVLFCGCDPSVVLPRLCVTRIVRLAE